MTTTLYAQQLAHGQQVPVRAKDTPQARAPRQHVMDSGESVRFLRGTAKLTEKDLATVTKADPRTVRRWSHRETEPQARFHQPLDDLRETVTVLQGSLTTKGIRQWLWGRNGYLKGERPINLLREGNFDHVYEAAVAFTEGVYV